MRALKHLFRQSFFFACVHSVFFSSFDHLFVYILSRCNFFLLYSKTKFIFDWIKKNIYFLNNWKRRRLNTIVKCRRDREKDEFLFFVYKETFYFRFRLHRRCRRHCCCCYCTCIALYISTFVVILVKKKKKIVIPWHRRKFVRPEYTQKNLFNFHVTKEK